MRYITHSKYRNWSECDVRRILNCDIYRIYFLNAMYVASACGVLMKPYFAPRLFKVGIASQDELLEDENGDVDDEDDDDEWVGRALDQEKRTQRAVDSSRISIERNIETLQNAVSNIDSKISKLEQLFGEAIARE